MSWILGILSKNLQDDSIQKIQSLHSKPIFQIQTKLIYVAAGGIESTLHFHKSKESFWIISGCGLELKNGFLQIVTKEDWNRLLMSKNFNPNQLEGHFVCIVYQYGKLKCWCDQIGLRTLYFTKSQDAILFSTRLDWLSTSMETSEVDFSTFGARWLTFNQISYSSPIHNIRKLGPGGFATCTSENINTGFRYWLPKPVAFQEPEYDAVLESLVSPINIEPDSIAAGVSGGLDSRFLLVLILSRKKQRIYTYTFGDPEDPDVSIPQNIAHNERLEHVVYNDPLPTVDACINILKQYAAETCMVTPSSTAMHLRYYTKLHSNGRMIIDGGLGEIGRRKYFNRLLLRGRKGLITGNIYLTLPHIRFDRVNIFNADAERLMIEGTLQQIRTLWENMPDINEFGIENFLDLLAIRTRFPNYGGIGQTRMDSQVLSYMPFAQPLFLNMVFSLPIKKRRNGIWMRQTIKRLYPSLAKYPLVSGNTTYPFIFNTTFARIWTRLKSSIGLAYTNDSTDHLFHYLSEFIRDTASSIDIKTYAPYEYRKIEQIVNGYYSGKKEFRKKLDWWLSFELWRQSTVGKLNKARTLFPNNGNLSNV